jgi:hypothetical protein
MGGRFGPESTYALIRVLISIEMLDTSKNCQMLDYKEVIDESSLHLLSS